MKLIAGLGNVGDKYLFTRHNIGFMALDFFRELNDIGENFKFENKFNGHILKTNILGEPIILVKPDTFMNLSGECIRKVFDFYKLDVKDILVVYDDISLNLGTLRFRSSGSDGGHNGIKNIIKMLGTNKFDRLKLGIGPQLPNQKSENFVLANFNHEQLDVVKKICKIANDAIVYYIKNNINDAQNKFNGILVNEWRAFGGFKY